MTPRGAFLILALPVSVLLALFLGIADISPAGIFAVLIGEGDGPARHILIEIRLPRILTGALAGAQFAAAGAILQRITRNPLADPTLLGISQGAILAVSFFLLFSVYWNVDSSYTDFDLPIGWMPVVGALGGITAAALTFTLASGHGGGPMRLTLCGIAVGAVLNALSLGLIAGWSSQRLEVVMRWMSGNLYARGWDDLRFLALTTLPFLLPLGLVARPLELAGFRADLARGWGMNWPLWYPLLIALASALAATAAGTTGPLLFVGLMAPHLAKWLWRSQGPAPVPAAALVGALLVTLADLTGRLIGGAEEIPVGVVTALLGTPILLIRLRREAPA